MAGSRRRVVLALAAGCAVVAGVAAVVVPVVVPVNRASRPSQPDGYGHMCTAIGAIEEIAFTLPPSVAAKITTLTATLAQGDHTGTVRFTTSSYNSRTGRMTKHARRIGLDYYPQDRSYHLRLNWHRFAPDGLGTGWTPEEEAMATLTGRDARGATLLAHEERFTFESFWPNGPECDPPSVRHTLDLAASNG